MQPCSGDTWGSVIQAGSTPPKILRLSEGLPVVAEIVDSQAKIDAFLPMLDGMTTGGLITKEKVQVLQYGDDG